MLFKWSGELFNPETCFGHIPPYLSFGGVSGKYGSGFHASKDPDKNSGGPEFRLFVRREGVEVDQVKLIQKIQVADVAVNLFQNEFKVDLSSFVPGGPVKGMEEFPQIFRRK